MAFPYIISPLPGLPGEDRKSQSVDDRKGVAVDRTINIGGSHNLVAPEFLRSSLSPSPLSQSILQIKSFDELFGTELAPIPPDLDTNKLSIFNQNQNDQELQVI